MWALSYCFHLKNNNWLDLIDGDSLVVFSLPIKNILIIIEIEKLRNVRPHTARERGWREGLGCFFFVQKKID
jgi:hypothetical protein